MVVVVVVVAVLVVQILVLPPALVFVRTITTTINTTASLAQRSPTPPFHVNKSRHVAGFVLKPSCCMLRSCCRLTGLSRGMSNNSLRHNARGAQGTSDCYAGMCPCPASPNMKITSRQP